MDDVVTSVECAVCAERYDAASTAAVLAGERPSCSKCGAAGVKVNVLVQDTATIHERADIKAKHEGERRPFMEQRVGDDLHRKSGTWSTVRRTIDRDADRYVEHITDHDGVVVRDLDVPLSEHRGHGHDSSQEKAHP